MNKKVNYLVSKTFTVQYSVVNLKTNHNLVGSYSYNEYVKC